MLWLFFLPCIIYKSCDTFTPLVAAVISVALLGWISTFTAPSYIMSSWLAKGPISFPRACIAFDMLLSRTGSQNASYECIFSCIAKVSCSAGKVLRLTLFYTGAAVDEISVTLEEPFGILPLGECDISRISLQKLEQKL